MRKKSNDPNNERGAVLVIVAILLIVIIGALAFAVDINHLYVVRNELQNAADAGALAGAGNLYSEDGTELNLGANKIAYDTALSNRSDKFSVEVIFNDSVGVDDNTHDVQRGHWSFNTSHFTPNDSQIAVPLWGVSDEELDSDPDNINAVRVVARRKDQPAISFFARIFGFDSFVMEADAVAYIGFSGSLEPYEADQPIVICEEYLRNEAGEFECNMGRMLNSGNAAGESTINTAGWSDMTVFEKQEDCNGTASTPAIKDKVCNIEPGQGGANSSRIESNLWLQANNGVKVPPYTQLRDECLEEDGTTPAFVNGERPMEMKLPVVDCDGTTVGNCVRVTNAVVVNLLYMSDVGTPDLDALPTSMSDPNDDPENPLFRSWNWPGSCLAVGHVDRDESDDGGGDFVSLGNEGLTRDAALDRLNGTSEFPYFDAKEGEWLESPIIDPDRWSKDPLSGQGQGRWGSESVYTPQMAQWDCFVDHFGLKNDDERMAPLAKKSMYFMPDCSPHGGAGETGGSNFGVRAKYPVLVE